MTTASDPREKLIKQTSLSSVTSDTLYDRSSEISVLENSYYAALTMRRNSPANIVLINGESGMGKTRLAEQLLSYAKEDGGFYIRGKFDQSSFGTANLPYLGITNAFREFCSQLEQREDERNEIVKALEKELEPSEGTLLCEAFPSLRRILPCHEYETYLESANLFSEDSSGSSKNRSHRLNYLLKKFTSAITGVLGDPIILLMDDMQWSDASSLEVLKTMASAAKSPFIFVFTFRPLARDHPFIQMIDVLGKRNSVSEITLRGLSTCGANELLCGILRLDSSDERCGPLSSFLCRLTNGNPLFIRQHIISLLDKGLIHFNDNELVWDLDCITSSDALSGSLNSMTVDKIKRLSESTQFALQLCASIGSTINFEVLGILARELYFENTCTENDLSSTGKRAISSAIEDGLMVESSCGCCVSFIHDSVQSAAYSLLEVEDRAMFHRKNGHILKASLSDDFGKWPSDKLFIVANQYARGFKCIQEFERILVVKILFRATEESRLVADFRSAHYFFGVLEFLLSSHDWTHHYRLTCKVFLTAAENALWADELHSTDRWLNLMGMYIRGSKIDEIGALWVRLNWIASTCGSVDDTINYGLKELRKLTGIKIPTRNPKLRTMIALAKTKKMMKGHTASTLLKCPRMAYIQISLGLRVLNLIAIFCAGARSDLTGLVCLKVIELNMTFGISSSMPVALALYGVILNAQGNILQSYHYADMALRLQEELNCNETRAQVATLCYGMIKSFSQNSSECIKHLRDAHSDGLQAGDVRHSMICAHLLCLLLFHSGQNLAIVDDSLDKYSRLMREFNTPTLLKVNLIYKQAVTVFRSHLRRSSRKPSFTLKRVMPKDSSQLEKEHAFSSQSMVAFILDDYKTAWSSSRDFLSSTSNQLQQKILLISVLVTFFRCMTAFCLLETEKSKKKAFTYKKAIRSSMMFIKKVVMKSPLYFGPLMLLLEAEHARRKKKFGSLDHLFLSSIEKFSEAGQIHLEALAWERFALYHIQRGKDGQEKLRRAHALYSEWGATLKCELMVRKNLKLFNV